jgi:hypothetical protein
MTIDSLDDGTNDNPERDVRPQTTRGWVATFRSTTTKSLRSANLRWERPMCRVASFSQSRPCRP